MLLGESDPLLGTPMPPDIFSDILGLLEITF